MPFIGTTPTQGFVSSFPKQSFTPNGSTTVFTLTNPVATANDLEVFVGNVRQEPTTAYTAAGTTLTMSEAPATGLNFYVINKSFAQVTTTPPANSISTDKIVNSAITDAKIASGITASKLTGQRTTTALIACSGSSVELTGLPSTWSYLEFNTTNMSPNGSATIRFQVGNSSGYATSGYESDAIYIYNQSGGSAVASLFPSGDTGGLSLGDWGASITHNISGCFHKMHGTNEVVGWFNAGLGGGTYQGIMMGTTRVTLANIDRIRVICSNNSFDSGSFAITYF